MKPSVLLLNFHQIQFEIISVVDVLRFAIFILKHFMIFVMKTTSLQYNKLLSVNSYGM
jgi:hypothetical protein